MGQVDDDAELVHPSHRVLTLLRQPATSDPHLGAIGEDVAAAVGEAGHAQPEVVEDVEQLQVRFQRLEALEGEEATRLAGLLHLLEAVDAGDQVELRVLLGLTIEPVDHLQGAVQRPVEMRVFEVDGAGLGRQPALEKARNVVLPHRLEVGRVGREVVELALGAVVQPSGGCQPSCGGSSTRSPSRILRSAMAIRMSLCPSMTIASRCNAAAWLIASALSMRLLR